MARTAWIGSRRGPTVAPPEMPLAADAGQRGRRRRLTDIGVSGLGPAPAGDLVDLVDPAVARRAAAEHAIDTVRAKFGDQAVLRGKLYPRRRSSRKPQPAETDSDVRD